MAERDDEWKWIRQSLDGDTQAFENLVKRYQRMIHSLTYRMTGSLTDAEDLAQEAFIRAYRNLGSYRGGASFSSWLYRIALNSCLNWKTSIRRRETMHEELAANGKGPASSGSALSERVQEALMGLKPRQRAAIVLTTLDGLSHAEAARALGCSETTISWRVFAARKTLRKLLKHDSLT